MNKKVFYRLGNHWINQYEVRRVELLKPTARCPKTCIPIPKATIWFKDNTEITVTSKRVPAFLCALESA